MTERWQLLSPDGRLKRRPYFYRFIVIGMIAIIGGYFLREALTTNNEVSPYYVELSFIWSMIIIGLFTPFAMQRSRDIGISRWWALLLWLSPISDFKFMIIVNEYTGISINGKMLWLATIIALIGVVFIIMLFFSKSDENAIK